MPLLPLRNHLLLSVPPADDGLGVASHQGGRPSCLDVAYLAASTTVFAVSAAAPTTAPASGQSAAYDKAAPVAAQVSPLLF